MPNSSGIKVDLDWDDIHIFPSTIYPNLAFLFQRMNEVTIAEVEARDGERILDIGCGRAIDAIELGKRGGKCLGLEPSAKMIGHARDHIAKSGTEVALIRGIGEYLPFKDCSFDKVICKGALDHFSNPGKAAEETARVLKPDGKAILVIANFESLGFRLARRLLKVVDILHRGRPDYSAYKVWQIPADHTYKFDYAFLKHLVEPHLRIERSVGISLFFGLPWWGQVLGKLPKGVSLAILKALDKLARPFPSLSDTTLIRCSPKPEIKSNY